jgi:hypothetical protein
MLQLHYTPRLAGASHIFNKSVSGLVAQVKEVISQLKESRAALFEPEPEALPQSRRLPPDALSDEL